ncbi:hypothetical protein [Haloarcula salinisoli]|uniref:DUF7982 domain-containing protein n=1 Tax=Haloarcula salinisoli TaxID=2487746 RepID=A0A8J7YAU9_9EURY|nr:hypothetical protein [Halomicroarcula salinisoli]MBX0286464.1 hypothetical protein [Halomicroarcula salinisoli]MBX0302047.1 hypothetical protein [Halomicroarcula salinisoli]
MGLLLILAAVLFAMATSLPTFRQTLVTLGVVGIFGSILLYVVTPERFLPADVTRAVESVRNQNVGWIVEKLSTSQQPRYVPTADGIKLFFPEFAGDETPDIAEVETGTEPSDSVSGIVLKPSGDPFLQLVLAEAGRLPRSNAEAVDSLSTALVDRFGLAEAATVESIDDDHVTIEVSGSIFDQKDNLDHPIVSLFATGLAHSSGTEVRPTVTTTDTDDLLITLRIGAFRDP